MVLVGALLTLGAPAGARAQTASMVGTVKDSLGRPIVDAELQVGLSFARTDTIGRYYIAFPAADSITVHVRRMGFERATFTVSSRYVAENAVEIRLQQVAQALAEVGVEERSARSRTELKGFDDRRANGSGTYLTREQIAARGTDDLATILRAVSGIEIVRGRSGRQMVRFAKWRGKRGCEPQIWVDGHLARGAEIDEFPASGIEGIELYDGPATTPSQFAPGFTMPCGTILLWSRIPVPRDSTRRD